MNENLVRIMRAEHLLHQVCEDALSEYVAECGSRDAAITKLSTQFLFVDKIAEATSDGDIEVNWGVLISSEIAGNDQHYMTRYNVSESPEAFETLLDAVRDSGNLSKLVKLVADGWNDEEHYRVICEIQAEEELWTEEWEEDSAM
ncbi:hypothetical protein J4729_20870 [Leisingera sp. HS039]|uniref:hypothetical protein n=1 Tax=unclassified Leisingera TaxID=2614906 RepID=UPI0010709E00|nr:MULTISPECIES: hypothetical protein [unclassified Leisingera]MBQ4826977.1 hypothetical protein [Leisingera sp. HS039]QBR35383.1 hypothetical protein ETW23_03755 [Leisingera sp. NJS201]